VSQPASLEKGGDRGGGINSSNRITSGPAGGALHIFLRKEIEILPRNFAGDSNNGRSEAMNEADNWLLNAPSPDQIGAGGDWALTVRLLDQMGMLANVDPSSLGAYVRCFQTLLRQMPR